MYAGVERLSRPIRAAPFKGQFAPRGGVAWSLTEKTVIRGGYGFFWAPTQFSGVGEAVMGTRGYTASTSFLSSNDGGLTPAGTLSNPFPTGFAQPQGNFAGTADRRRRRRRLRRPEREARLRPSVLGRLPVGTAGQQRRHGRLHGQPVRASDIRRDLRRHRQHQPARSVAISRSGRRLQQLVPNPFFGNPAFGNLSRSATIARGQLLRPFPQFTRRVRPPRQRGASARYNALALKWERRMQNGLGGVAPTTPTAS